MWVGEGFVHLEREEGGLFETGERYFNELVNRSMIQALEDKIDRLTQRFRVHDIVFDLIRKLSRDENFVTIFDSKEKHATPNSLSRQKKTSVPLLDSKVRRLAVLNHHVQRFPEHNMSMPEGLRSLNIFSSKIEIMAPLHSFRVLRALSIESSNIPISLKHIGRLLHLKRLVISNTTVDELPNEIGYLKSLQTLVLRRIGLDQLPPAICSLTRLMNLRAEGFRELRLPANRMGDLTSLEEVRLSVVGRNAIEDLVVALGKLTKLRVVIIAFSEKLEDNMQKDLVQSLRNLQGLQELVLSSTGLRQDGTTVWEDWEAPRKLRRLRIYGITLSRLPGWINRSTVPRLCFLSLGVYTVEAQDLDNLVRLPELSYLELRSFSWPPSYAVGTDSFKNLRICYVDTALKFHTGAMPRVEMLQFGVFAVHRSFQVNCVPLEQLTTNDVIEDLDLGLDNLLSLEKVTVGVNCLGATAAEVQKVEAIVTSAVQNHPNRPTIKMDRVYEKHIISGEHSVALLQHHIEKHFSVLEWKDESDARLISYLQWYQHLQEAVISIDCAGASMNEVDKLEAALRHAAEVHPNHPVIQLIRTNTDDTELRN